MAKEMTSGELAIQKVLDSYNIKYEYDQAMLIKEEKIGDKERLRMWYPDFWLPKYSIVIEYFGMEGNPSYDQGKKDKIAAYKKNDIDYIPVYKKTTQGDLKGYLLMSIKRLINEKVKHFENRNKEQIKEELVR